MRRPAKLPLDIEARSAWTKVLRWGTGDPLEPYNLTGYTGFGQIRNPRNGALVSEINVAITDAADGEFTLTLPSTDLPVGSYAYDVFLQVGSADPIKVFFGVATVHRTWSVAP